MQRLNTITTKDPLLGPIGPVLRVTPSGNRRVHDQDDGLRATRDDPQGSRFQTQGPIRNEGDFPNADASYDGYGAYAVLDGSRVDTAEFADLDFAGPLLEPDGDGDAEMAGPRSDSSIDEEVRLLIADDPDLHALGLEIAVDRGEVWLHGNVGRRSLKRLAEDVAYRAAGVLDVHNRLRVAPSQPTTRSARSG